MNILMGTFLQISPAINQHASAPFQTTLWFWGLMSLLCFLSIVAIRKLSGKRNQEK
jgi:hypothetical protein